jgi:hypothetical protein
MRLVCCNDGCDATAAYEVQGTHAGKWPYEDSHHACAEHLADLVDYANASASAAASVWPVSSEVPS